MNAILTLSHVSKTFLGNNYQSCPVLKDISFSVNPGQSIGLVGCSGSGKSTLARLIAGFDKPDSGDVILDGIPIDTIRAKKDFYKKVQLISQDPYTMISPRMTVGQFLGQGLLNYRLCDRRHLKEAVNQLLVQVGLSEEFANRLPDELSGGQLQRVGIARAISLKPQLLIFDEATSSLDSLVQKQILNLLAQLKKEYQLTYIVIGHDLSVVRCLTECIMVLRDGKIIETVASQSILTAARHPYTLELLSAVNHLIAY